MDVFVEAKCICTYISCWLAAAEKLKGLLHAFVGFCRLIIILLLLPQFFFSFKIKICNSNCGYFFLCIGSIVVSIIKDFDAYIEKSTLNQLRSSAYKDTTL